MPGFINSKNCTLASGFMALVLFGSFIYTSNLSDLVIGSVNLVAALLNAVNWYHGRM